MAIKWVILLTLQASVNMMVFVFFKTWLCPEETRVTASL